MNRIKILVAVLLLHTLPVLLVDSSPVFSAMDVFELEWASDPQISPDGRHVTYVRNGMDILVIYLPQQTQM